MEQRYKVYGDEIRFTCCPICGRESKDNPCFSVNKEKGIYYCHSTGQGGELAEIENFDFDLKNIKIPKKKKQVNFNNLMQDRAEHHLNDVWLNYLKGRGITGKGLARTVRMSKSGAMMIFLTNGKEVVGVKYRTLEKKLSCEPGSSSEYFVNWQNVKDKSYLIIVEGEIDLLSAIEAGFDNVVSLPFGAKNTKCIDTQMDWLKEFQKIIIATDNDDPGRESADEIIKKLKIIKNKIFTVSLGEYKDFNEVLVSEDGIKKLQKIVKKSEKVELDWNPFSEEEDGYYILQKESYNKLTDFTIELTGYSNLFLIGNVTSNGRSRSFKAKKTDLLQKNGILENLGYYLGSSQSIAKFWDWIINKNPEIYLDEIDHYGIINNIYYDSDSKVVCSREDLKIKKISEIDNLTSEEMEWLNTNLIHLRKDTNQSLLGICWALGRFHIDGAYPLLECSGTTSIGKTEYVEFISRLLFGNKENIKSFSTLTNHQIRSFSSCSNITPWAIDEVKITGKNLKEKAMDLYSTIRAVYDNKTINQGNVTNKLTEFKLCSPLIISGETELSDVSIKNRMISTKLNKKNKSSDEVFFKLKETDLLEKLGKKVLKNRLDLGAIKLDSSTVKAALKNVKDERQLYNGACILTGLKALSGVIKMDKEVTEKFIIFLDNLLANEFNVVSNFIELLDLVAESGKNYDSFYVNNEKGHYARFNLLYKAIAEEHYRTNSTLELLDSRTLKKQLIEEGFIVIARANKRFLKDEFTSESIVTTAVIFKSIEL